MANRQFLYEDLTPRDKADVRYEYTKEQKGLCLFCEAPLDGDPRDTVLARRLNMSLFPPNFLDNPTHLHHDHNTGLTVGVVHARCNAVLWQDHGE